MKSILPVILVVLLLTGAITFALSKRVIPKREENRFGIAANELKSDSDIVTPTPSAKVSPTPTVTPKTTPTPTVTPVSQVAEISVTEDQSNSTKGGVSTTAQKTTKTVTTTTKTVICLPRWPSFLCLRQTSLRPLSERHCETRPGGSWQSHSTLEIYLCLYLR